MECAHTRHVSFKPRQLSPSVNEEWVPRVPSLDLMYMDEPGPYDPYGLYPDGPATEGAPPPYTITWRLGYEKHGAAFEVPRAGYLAKDLASELKRRFPYLQMMEKDGTGRMVDVGRVFVYSFAKPDQKLPADVWVKPGASVLVRKQRAYSTSVVRYHQVGVDKAATGTPTATEVPSVQGFDFDQLFRVADLAEPTPRVPTPMPPLPVLLVPPPPPDPTVATTATKPKVPVGVVEVEWSTLPTPPTWTTWYVFQFTGPAGGPVVFWTCEDSGTGPYLDALAVIQAEALAAWVCPCEVLFVRVPSTLAVAMHKAAAVDANDDAGDAGDTKPTRVVVQFAGRQYTPTPAGPHLFEREESSRSLALRKKLATYIRTVGGIIGP